MIEKEHRDIGTTSLSDLDGKRIHNTQADELYLDGDYEQKINGFDIKPIGLWYAFGRSWKEWCADSWPERLYPNDFELQIKPDRIVTISSLAAAHEFTDLYADKKYWAMGLRHIDWQQVVDLYSGIEIPNYWHIKAQMWRSKGPLLTWLYAWDVPSGVIWNLQDVVSVKKIENQQAMISEKWIMETHKCCSCERPLKDTGSKHVNLVQLPYKTSWKFPTFGNVLQGTSMIAGASVCDDCLEKKPHGIKFALEYTGPDLRTIIYHPIDELEKIQEENITN